MKALPNDCARYRLSRQVFTPAGTTAQKAMPQPLQPQDPNLTKKGTPRKIAPGSGRPLAHRKTRLSMVTKQGHEDIMAVAAAWECTQAEAIERMASAVKKKLQQS